MSTKGKTWKWSEEAKVNARKPHTKAKGNKNGVTHGLSQTLAYNSWKKMVSRCTDPSNSDYKYYGGRGVKVCERWLDVTAFYEDMGERKKGWSIERIEVDGDYTPDNCFWIPMKYQAKNRRKWNHTAEGKANIAAARRKKCKQEKIA